MRHQGTGSGAAAAGEGRQWLGPRLPASNPPACSLPARSWPNPLPCQAVQPISYLFPGNNWLSNMRTLQMVSIYLSNTHVPLLTNDSVCCKKAAMWSVGLFVVKRCKNAALCFSGRYLRAARAAFVPCCCWREPPVCVVVAVRASLQLIKPPAMTVRTICTPQQPE